MSLATENPTCLAAVLLIIVQVCNLKTAVFVDSKYIPRSSSQQKFKDKRQLFGSIVHQLKLPLHRNQITTNYQQYELRDEKFSTFNSGRLSKDVKLQSEQQGHQTDISTFTANSDLLDRGARLNLQGSTNSVSMNNLERTTVSITDQSEQSTVIFLHPVIVGRWWDETSRSNTAAGRPRKQHVANQPKHKVLSDYFSRQENMSSHEKMKRSPASFPAQLHGETHHMRNFLSNDKPRTRCSTDHLAFRVALLSGKEWAKRMADSSAHVGAGLMDKELDLLGIREECLPIQVPTLLHFQTQYCVVTFTLDQIPYPEAVTQQKLTGPSVGLCVPDTCKEEDVTAIFNKSLKQTHLKGFNVQHVFCTQQEETNLAAGAAGTITFLCLWVVLMLIATVLQIFGRRVTSLCLPVQRPQTKRQLTSRPRVRYRRLREEEQEPLLSTTEPAETNFVQIDMNIDSDSSNVSQPQQLSYRSVSRRVGSKQSKEIRGILRRRLNISLDRSATDSRKEELNSLWQLLKCFSVKLHLQKLLDTTRSETEIACLHGIRVLSLVWVVLLNTVMYQIMFTRNTSQLLKQWREHSLVYSFIGNGNLGLDSLFTLSGLLVGYVYSHELDKKMGRMNWVAYVLFRHWKIVPTLAIISVIYLALFPPVVNGSQLFDRAPDYDVCMERGWMNALLVQNFASSLCMSWTWFLAVDFQLFLFTPFLLLLLYHRPRLTYLLVFFFVLASWITNGVLTRIHDLPVAQFILPNLDNITNSSVSVNAFTSYYLYKPWTHAGTFFPPLLLGFLLQKCNRRASFRTRTVVVGWVGSFAAAMAVLCGANRELVGEGTFSVETKALYNAMQGTVWSVCICWVVLACSTGYGGPVNSFLSWSGWKPFSRLTFVTYLIHPIIVMCHAARLGQLVYLSTTVAVYHFCGVLVCSLLVSAAFTLALEMPLNALFSWTLSCCASSTKNIK